MEIRKEEIEEEKEEIDEEKEEESSEENEEEESSKNKNNIESNDIQNEEKKPEIKNITESEIKADEKEPEDIDPESTSTYILKYTRKGDELKELAEETGLRKSENCLFMLNIKLIKSDSVLTENESPSFETSENFLVFCCHEIAAIYFDEIYERIYTLKDLANENKYFKVFESTEEAKIVIDETIRTNEKNAKKIFIGFKDKELKLHMKLSFFDKEKEIVLNIPKKPLSDEDKINLLPEFLKEIQDKMNHLNDENKKLKAKKLAFGNRGKDNKYNYKNNIVNESIEIAKEKKDKNTNMSFEHNEVQFNEFKAEEININPDNNTKNNDVVNNTVNVGSGNNVVHKKVKKLKVIKKKQSKPEENFF
jgi:hypothetical protein